MHAEDRSRALYAIARRCAAQEPGITADRLRARTIELLCESTFMTFAGEALAYAEELFQGSTGVTSEQDRTR